MLKTLIPLLALGAAAVAALWYVRRPSVSSADAHRLVAEGALLVDVRSPTEYESGHIDGAINVPVDRIAAQLDRIGPKQRTVIVYCASGMRSAAAARALRAAGYGDVRNLGSISSW